MARAQSFRRFILSTIICIYLVIFAGGLVRVSGAGLGCPDWPKCFGRWIPPTSINQLPPDLDPAQFNITLAWIEYLNRLVGVIVGFLITATAIWSMAKFRQHQRIVFASVAAAVLVAFQGWYGSVVVSSGLHQTIVSAHYFLALLIAGIMIYIYVQAYYLDIENAKTQYPIPKDIRLWSMILFLLAFVQIVLGTQIRGTLERLVELSPLLGDSERLESVGLINHLHLALGLTIAAITFVFGLRVRKSKDSVPPLINFGAACAVILVSTQIILGLIFIVFGLVPQAQLFHLSVASLYLGMLILILSATFIKKEE